MLISNFGYGAMVVAFVVALYGAVASVYGARKNSLSWVESARLAMILSCGLVTLAMLSLLMLLVNHDFQVQFVYSVTSRSMPLYLRLTALWGGQAGSLLFWSWLLSLFGAAVALRNWDRDREFLPWVILVTMVTLVFFLLLSVFIENPFMRYWTTVDGQQFVAMFSPRGGMALVPRDGSGLNPLLRHPGMILHPPMQYLGFVSFVVPYAFAIAALVTGRTDDRWIRVTRRWTLIAWLFLSLGLVLGSRWAYDVLGWGGYWGWDPVEIAALMPWLSGTAFLHSVMIQERKGLFKRWNIVLVILTYSLIILGTFLTRSGVLSSVHAFSRSAIGPLFFGFIGISFVISLGLLLHRWNDLQGEGQMTSLLSREAMFLVNNLLFMGVLAVCFWGVMYPLISELFTGQKVTVGPPFYERATAPLFGALLLIMAVAPLSAWGRSAVRLMGRTIWIPLAASLVVVAVLLITGMRNWVALVGFWLCALVLLVTLLDYGRGVLARRKQTGEPFLLALWNLAKRNRRRYGGYIIHLSMVLMALGILGIEIYQVETQGTLKVGESITLRDYTITYDSLALFDTNDGRNVARAEVSVQRDGVLLGKLTPRRDFFYDSQQPMTIPGLHSTLQDDLYVILVDWQPISSEGTTFKVYVNPLVNWIWIGAFVFILGTLVAAWPDNELQKIK